MNIPTHNLNKDSPNMPRTNGTKKSNLLSTQGSTSAGTKPALASSPPLIATTSPATYGTVPAPPKRAPLPRAQTTTSMPAPQATATASATLPRPILTRAQTTTNAPAERPTVDCTGNSSTPPARPSLLKRISSQIDNALELTTATSYTHRNRPATPSHWTNHAHRSALLETWDSIHEAAASSKSKYPKSVLGQLVAVQNSILLQFPELAEGEVPLGREWMEYVLGVALRHPFCAEGKMGRWEVLSGAAKVGGMRGWGPW